MNSDLMLGALSFYNTFQNYFKENIDRPCSKSLCLLNSYTSDGSISEIDDTNCRKICPNYTPKYTKQDIINALKQIIKQL